MSKHMCKLGHQLSRKRGMETNGIHSFESNYIFDQIYSFAKYTTLANLCVSIGKNHSSFQLAEDLSTSACNSR